MKPYDITVLKRDCSLTIYDHISLILKDIEFHDAVTEIFYALEELEVKYNNLVWLKDHIDTLRTDHVFQEVVGLQLRQEGYTSSVEVAGGISKTMSNVWDRITEFFRKLMRYLREVMSVSAKAAKELCDDLKKKCEDPNNVEKLKKKYTTHGESVTSIVNAMDAVHKTIVNFQKTVDDLKSKNSNEEQVQVEGQQQKAQTFNKLVVQAKERMDKESGNGDDQKNTEDGVDPIEGKWFDPTALASLSNALNNADTNIGTLKNIESTIRALQNNVKSNTQMSKEMATSIQDTIKVTMKSIDDTIRLLMRCTTIVGKKCQILLNIVK